MQPQTAASLDDLLAQARALRGSVTAAEVAITQAAPFYLLADSPDGAPLQIRRTRAGDAWDRTQAESCGVPAPASTATTADGRRAVGLGIPTLRVGP